MPAAQTVEQFAGISSKNSFHGSLNPRAQFREQLTDWYGRERAKNIKYAEAFEICEYGRQPSVQDLKDLFPGAYIPRKKDLKALFQPKVSKKEK